MTSLGFIELLAQLGVERSLSRPRVSNDNPFSESAFKTAKYQPDYPGRFESVGHARRWFSEFFEWYAHRHSHSGLALFTPADVFFGRIPTLAANRQRALDTAYQGNRPTDVVLLHAVGFQRAGSRSSSLPRRAEFLARHERPVTIAEGCQDRNAR